MSDHEFIKWLGIRLVMRCYKRKWGRRDWWSKDNILIRRGPPLNLNEYMSRVRFEQIRTRIKYIDEDPPHYVDMFFHAWKLVEAWNVNTSTNFNPGWISCLDKSMMIWKNIFGPGWVVLFRNPHPFNNGWHTICCAMSVVVFFVELVEGKDRTKERGNTEFKADFGENGGMMMWMKKQLFGIGKDVVMGSRFCVLKGIVGMLAHGVYGTTATNKNILAQLLQGGFHQGMVPIPGGCVCL